jgi:hypothetical protein
MLYCSCVGTTGLPLLGRGIRATGFEHNGGFAMLDIEGRGRYEVEGCPSDERCLWAATDSLPAYLMLQTRAGWVALRFIEGNLLAAEAMALRQRFVSLFIYAALLRGNGEQLVRSMRVYRRDSQVD